MPDVMSGLKRVSVGPPGAGVEVGAYCKEINLIVDVAKTFLDFYSGTIETFIFTGCPAAGSMAALG